jgi:hypothetical protein
MSICSPEDQFNKKTGRKLALKRLFSNWYDGPEHQQFRTNVWEALVEKGMKLV